MTSATQESGLTIDHPGSTGEWKSLVCNNISTTNSTFIKHKNMARKFNCIYVARSVDTKQRYAEVLEYI